MTPSADIGLAGNRSKHLGGIALGILAAYLVATAISVGYRESEMINVALTLVLPPLVLLSVYRGSEKCFVFCAASLLLAALCFSASPVVGVPRVGLGLVLTTIGSIAMPVIVDLLVIDMGRRIHVGPLLVRTAQVAFLVTLIPLASWKLVTAHEKIKIEDGRLVGELATHLWAEGNTLVVDPVDRKTADRALRRLAIRTRDKTYPLSDADLESVRETRTVRKTTNAHGSEATTQITREQEDRLRLILKLQGTGIPDEVVLFSHRGPMPIAEAKVW